MRSNVWRSMVGEWRHFCIHLRSACCCVLVERPICPSQGRAVPHDARAVRYSGGSHLTAVTWMSSVCQECEASTHDVLRKPKNRQLAEGFLTSAAEKASCSGSAAHENISHDQRINQSFPLPGSTRRHFSTSQTKARPQSCVFRRRACTTCQCRNPNLL